MGCMEFTEILYFKKYTNPFMRIKDNSGCLPERPFLLVSNCLTWFPNADSTKAWLEIYQLPKDSWLTEMEKNTRAAEQLACSGRGSSCSPEVQNSSISLCAVFSDTFLPTGIPPTFAADTDSKSQAERSCQPKGMVCVCLHSCCSCPAHIS